MGKIEPGGLPVKEGRLEAGLSELLTARLCAEDVEGDPWWFAIEIDNLRCLNLTDTVLRWLVGREFLLHREEMDSAETDERAFQRSGRFRFTDHSCFVLSEEGREFTLWLLENPAATVESETLPSVEEKVLAPRWDARRRELLFGDCLVKRYRGRSPNQEAVMMAFEEEEWPSQIFDPLIPLPNLCPKRRLNDTIKCLNRHRVRPLIRFGGDGTGQGILWEQQVQ